MRYQKIPRLDTIFLSAWKRGWKRGPSKIPLDRKGVGAMRGIPGMNGAAIGPLRRQLQGLIDADLILPEDGQWLMAALDRTLQGVAAADLQASRSDLQGFIERLEGLIQSGDLQAATGDPPVEIARALLAALRGEESPAGRVRSAAGLRERRTGIRMEARVGIPAVPPPALPELHAPQEE
jgi:hypothetical protein